MDSTKTANNPVDRNVNMFPQTTKEDVNRNGPGVQAATGGFPP